MIGAMRIAVVIPGRADVPWATLLASIPASIDRVIVVDAAAAGKCLPGEHDDPRVEYVSHDPKDGAALATGMRAALRAELDVVVALDASSEIGPDTIQLLMTPILEGLADHVQLSQDHDGPNPATPRRRDWHEMLLTFLTKLSSGYWNVLDRASAVFATRAEVLGRIQLAKLSERHFESDLLIQLNILEARLADLPRRPAPAQKPRLSPFGALRASLHLLGGMGRRIFWRYLFYDVSPVAAFGITGSVLVSFGLGFGGFQWALHAALGVPTPNGTIMLAAAPLVLGFQLILHALLLDIANTPRAAGSAAALALPFFAPRPPSDPPLSSHSGAAPAALPSWAPAATVAETPVSARAVSLLSATAIVLTCIALADLAVRAALRLEPRWDTFAYHLPFAALRGGLDIPYELSDKMRPVFEGFPPLPHVVQGALWRATGSVNATGLVNLMAFGAFLTFAQRALRAPFWLVAPIALTAPTVLIQCSASYVDLFANSFLAAGASACVFLFLFPGEATRLAVIGGLLSLALASWSKFQLTPLVALMLCLTSIVALRQPHLGGLPRRQVALWCGAATLLAAAPYLKNVWFYQNPFWPIRVPLSGDLFPYITDPVKDGPLTQTPSLLRGSSQLELFIHSIFEINHPTRYAHRARWIIDQGNAGIAFRMGGFWGVGAAIYLVVVSVLLPVCARWRGALAAVGSLAVLAVVAHLPQSHELRYYMFIPLCGAAITGMVFRRLAGRAPRMAAGLLSLVIGLFLYMVSENRVHYVIEHVDGTDVAKAYFADRYWPKLQPGKKYCAVNVLPMGLLLTGPTLREFQIVERSDARLCPPGTEVITR
jgi:dolichol-phosphate mannosyltransferase